MRTDTKTNTCKNTICDKLRDNRFIYQKAYMFPQTEKELALLSLSLSKLTQNTTEKVAVPAQELSDELQYFLSIAG